MAGAGQTTYKFTGNPDDYSHDFQNQISDYTNKANQQYDQYQSGLGNAQNYENAYNEAFDNRVSYGDLMNAAENQYGVGDAKNQYQNSLQAVAATNQAMNALPSTTNANSGVVLTQAQRNAALGNQMSKYQNTLSALQQQNAVDQSALSIAMQQAANLAAGNYQSQQDALTAQMAQYQYAYDLANQAYQQALSQESLKRDVYSQMYADEAQHMQNEYNYWYGNLQDKWKQQEIAAQRYAADAQLRVSQYLQKKQEEAQNSAYQKLLNAYNNRSSGQDYLSSAGEYRVNGKTGSVEPTVSYRNGQKVLTYAAPI